MLKWSYLMQMKKTFEPFTTKTTKKDFEKRDRERNRRDRHFFLIKKSKIWFPFVFKIRNPINQEESSRNRKQQENRLDQFRGIEKELRQPETFKRKSYFFSFTFQLVKKQTRSVEFQKDRNFEKFWKNFSQKHLKNCFYDMT